MWVLMCVYQTQGRVSQERTEEGAKKDGRRKGRTSDWDKRSSEGVEFSQRRGSRTESDRQAAGRRRECKEVV